MGEDRTMRMTIGDDNAPPRGHFWFAMAASFFQGMLFAMFLLCWYLLFSGKAIASEVENQPNQKPAPPIMECHYEFQISLEFYGGRWRYIPVQIIVCKSP
jgi:hypothetical protein